MEVEKRTPLRDHRQRLGNSSREVAVALDIEPSHYRRIEIGEAQASPKIANKIAKYFGNAVTRDQILFPEDYTDVTGKRKPVRQAQLQQAS